MYFLSKRFRQFWSKIPCLFWRRRPRPKLVIRSLSNLKSKHHLRKNPKIISSVHQTIRNRPIRLATFNAVLFSLAPAVPKDEKSVIYIQEDNECPKIGNLVNPANVCPKGILKQSENEEKGVTKSKPMYFPASDVSLYGSRTIFDVLNEVDADIFALQDVKAEEENDMRPLSDLARALGMSYVFAESWAPEYGNAVLSKWPIKKWKVQNICDDKDFRDVMFTAVGRNYCPNIPRVKIWGKTHGATVTCRAWMIYTYRAGMKFFSQRWEEIIFAGKYPCKMNVIKATIDVPWTGELNVYCTQLDHLDENWRMKQINSIIQSNDQPHILAGGLNSLDSSDYSLERWNDIVKYYEELRKPSPKVEVTNLLKGKEYTDAKDFPGECEPVVMIAKGQNVQGTCKYGTRVDYILGSPGLSYKFVPGSYSVFSSKGTSNHHIVKVDIVKVADDAQKSRKSCFTHLPLRSPPVPAQESTGIAIVRVNNNNFVQFFLQPYYHVPPIPTWWWNNAFEEAKGWVDHYDRI